MSSNTISPYAQALPGLSRVAMGCWEKYGNPARLANAVRLKSLAEQAAEIVDAYPWRIVLEPISVCNLRCNGCSSFLGDLSRGLLDPDHAARFVDELLPWLVQVNLFNWGEPFMNPRLDQIIKLLHDHRVGTHVHSNMNRLPEGAAERSIEAGLDYLVASIDGVTQENYVKFRVQGHVDDALGNLRKVVAIRDRLNMKTPRIIWRYLCFPHSLAEIPRARKLAAEIGVDDFTLGEGRWGDEVWTEHGKRDVAAPGPAAAAGADAPRSKCWDLYDFPAIHWDGSLMPCCNADNNQFLYGNLNRQSWQEAFNTELFRSSRRLAGGNRLAPSPCITCPRITSPGASLPNSQPVELRVTAMPA